MKYVYFIPTHGFNDQLTTLIIAIKYCKKYNRILLIDTINSTYMINFASYFDFPYNNIICDSQNIRDILYNNEITIYPNILNGQMVDILDNKIKFNNINHAWNYNDVVLNLPCGDINEDIIIFIKNTGGIGYPLFKTIIFQPNLKQILNDRYNTLKKPYLSIQIRNTDRRCNYKRLYEKNKDIIHSASEIHIATDDTIALEFFVNKGLPIKNFTTFPSTKEYKNLHYSNIDPHTKFVDMLTDIYICGMSDKLLSSSSGGFIRLILDCNKKKIELATQFDIVIAPDKIPVDNNPDVLVKIPNIFVKLPDILDKIKDELVKIKDALDNI